MKEDKLYEPYKQDKPPAHVLSHLARRAHNQRPSGALMSV